MRILCVAALAVCVFPAIAQAAPRTSALTSGRAASAPAAAEPQGGMRVAMRQERLPVGGKMAEHRSDGERYLFVMSGQLKVSNLVTGDEQVVGAGKMAAEQPGDWHVAEALGSEPAVFYVIDRDPAQDMAATTADNQGN